LIAGSLLDASGIALKPAVWDLASGAVRPLDIPAPAVPDSALVAGWLTDSRRLLVSAGRGLALVDVTTGRWNPVPAIEGARQHRLSRDARTLVVQRTVLDADVWLYERK